MRSAAFVRRAAVVTAAAASLTACATIDSAPQPRPTPSGQTAAATPKPKPKHRPNAKPAPQRSAGGYKVGKPYQVNGVWYVPREQPDYDEVGTASWYGQAFHLKATANGERFDMNTLSAAHTTLPLPSTVEVTNLQNGRKVRVRVNDRGPFVGNRIIDLSREGARQLGYEHRGLARVRVRYVGPAPLGGREAGVRVASASSSRPRPAPVARAAPTPPTPMARASLSYRQPAATFTGAKAPVSVSRMEIMPTMAAGREAKHAEAAAYRIQAGAFRDETRARQAASKLNKVGPSVVEPIERDGVTLWRVTVQGPQDQLQAHNLRKRVADAGFADARVVGPF